MNKEAKVKTIGFSPEKEEVFLSRLPVKSKRENLGQELKTQLAEDFGLIKFTLKYKINFDGKIVDIISGQEIVELTSRGEVEEETESISKIEEGLRANPEKTWIHFSPENEELGYPQNCIDFWRVVDSEVIWNRIIVKNNFEEMNKTRVSLSGEEESKDEMDILRSPISTDLKLLEIFSLFELSEAKYFNDFNYIKRVVDKCLDDFDDEFGEDLVKNKDLIFRLYSACFNTLRSREEDNIIGRKELENYMFGIMLGMKTENSFGCSVTTTVGIFGEKMGYFILENGQVKFGKIPENFKECKKCGCWYAGEKCPFC